MTPVIAAVMVTASTAPSAEVLFTLQSPNPSANGQFGFAIANAGDVNGDGFDDMIIGAPGERTQYTGAGRAYVYDGATAVLLRTLISPNGQTQGRFGYSVAGAGDVDSDGCPDVAVGAPEEDRGQQDAGGAYVFSGADGSVLLEFASSCPGWGRFGHAVSGARDVDGDGHDDVIVGAPREPYWFLPAEPGIAYVFSGNDGGLLHFLYSPNYMNQDQGHFGWAVSGFGDMDGDGHDDVVVGAPGEWLWYGFDSVGRLYVLSGRSGEILESLLSPTVTFEGEFGNALSAAGDVNGDGHADFIAGAWLECRAHVFDGQTCGVLHSLQSPPPQNGFGCAVSGAGDVDKDGYDELIVGSFWENPGGKAHVFSGATGSPLQELMSPNPESSGYFGNSVCAVGHVTQGLPGYVVVGAPRENADSTDAGRAYVFSWMALSGALSAENLVLEWSAWPSASAYWVYGADNEPYFEPVLILPYQHRLAVLPSGTTTWTSPNGVGDPDHNWTYMVIAVGGGNQELCRSNRVGEHDFGMTIDK